MLFSSITERLAWHVSANNEHCSFFDVKTIFRSRSVCVYRFGMTLRHPSLNRHLMLVTANTQHRSQIFADPACAREAIESLYRVQYWNPFFLFGFVIMPDHCHFLMHVPGNGSISRVMHMYKQSVSFEIGKPVWQKRFHLAIVQSCGRVLDYVHMNPVRLNLCPEPSAYPWSSASGRWDVCALPAEHFDNHFPVSESRGFRLRGK